MFCLPQLLAQLKFILFNPSSKIFSPMAIWSLRFQVPCSQQFYKYLQWIEFLQGWWFWMWIGRPFIGVWVKFGRGLHNNEIWFYNDDKWHNMPLDINSPICYLFKCYSHLDTSSFELPVKARSYIVIKSKNFAEFREWLHKSGSRLFS